MKIAHLTTHLNMGGIPIYVYTVSLKLKKLGVDQIIISSEGSFAEKFRTASIPVFFFDIKTKFLFHWKLFRQLPKIIQLLKKEKVELIHAHTRVGQVLAQWIQIFSDIPFISTCHGFYKFKFSRKLFPAWGHRIIAISDLVREDLIKSHGISKKQIRTITNGIETETFFNACQPALRQESRKLLRLKKGDFAICFVARMIKDKGPEDILLAMNILLKKNICVKAFMLGDGKDKEMLIRLSDEFGLSSHINFMGNVFDVKPILSACNAFVHPVRIPEGFGLSIAEAMAAGLPVIVTDQWALADSMRMKNIGAIIQKESPTQIAAILEKWIHQPEAVKQMGNNARQTALELFDMKRVAAAIKQIYDETLSSK